MNIETKKDRALMDEIEHFLVEVGVPVELYGYKDLSEALYILYKGGNSSTQKRSLKNIYADVAKVTGSPYNNTWRHIEYFIRWAKKTGRHNLDSLSGFESLEDMSPRRVIYTLYQNFRWRVQNDGDDE